MKPVKYLVAALTFLFTVSFSSALCQGVKGYYRFPDIKGSSLYFVAEGDIWIVPVEGGLARRLTTHPGDELFPHVSPDGKTLAYTANYEGPSEVYTVPVDGGLPVRWTYESDRSLATTWSPSGNLIYTTTARSTLPDLQLVSINTETKLKTTLPFSQASEATYDDTGKKIFFVRPAYHNNVTKRYMGGTARQIWKYTDGSEEAVLLTGNYRGESHHPMWWNNRIYFITDRDGIMNIWSMNEDGEDLRQHTNQTKYDVRYASLDNGKIVFQVGADLWIYDIGSGKESPVEITLASDMDQWREKWVNNPSEYITSVKPSPDGGKIVITARGRVFVAPVDEGRFVQVSRKEGVRYRDANFLPDGDNIVVLSDESGEFEFVKIASDGIGKHTAMTNDGKVLRFMGFPSPDGKYLAYSDLKNDFWMLEIASGKQKKLSPNREGIRGVSWSPDSKWISWSQVASNTFAQILTYGVEDNQTIAITTDRANSTDPAWSPDGKWLYFISDRNFQSLVTSTWGSRQPEPYFDRKDKIYQVALTSGLRSPFRPADELWEEKESPADKNPGVTIEKAGIRERIYEVPVKPGNYRGLSVNKNGLYWISSGTGIGASSDLMVLKTGNDDPEAKVMIKGVRSADMTTDGKKLLVRKGAGYFMVEAGTSPVSKLDDSRIDLTNWHFSIDPREDWKQIFTDAWRMERDYFYDPNMHNVDWDAMYQKYLPLVERITTRAELSDLIGRYVGELSVLHTSVRGGDVRSGVENVSVASLGALMTLDAQKEGYVINKIYRADPDYPDAISPLADPYLNISEGDVITRIDGDPVVDETDIGALLRGKAGKQVRLSLKEKSGLTREVIITPLRSESGLRYSDWEYSRRMIVENKGEGKIGYLHLRAMGGNDIAQWYREFYPVFDRQGLIVDVRHNRGGNIDSFILEKLLRKAWFYWQYRNKQPAWNMQYAFRGHIVVLVDQNTASDGEAFAEGFRRLGLGKVIGMRTWGGEVWLGSQNRLSDGGLARAPMNGVYGPDGIWLIEGTGVIPDIEVDNLPHATFNGSDQQLDTAIDHLLKLIEEDPREVPPHPPYPDKRFEK